MRESIPEKPKVAVGLKMSVLESVNLEKLALAKKQVEDSLLPFQRKQRGLDIEVMEPKKELNVEPPKKAKGK